MDKEKLITIGIGLLVGIGAASLYFAATKVIPQIGKKKPIEIVQSQKNQKSEAKTPPYLANSTQITLNLPVDNSTATDNISTVSGQTTPNATIIIFANAAEKIASSGADGKFNEMIKLEEGLNTISVTAIDGQNNPSTIVRNVALEISQ